MREFDLLELKKLYIPPTSSHKGENGKLLVIGGSHLFHAASLWALEIASKIVDMVFYVSVPENEKIVQDAKEAFRNGIVVPREKIEEYIKDSDGILIGPGMNRIEHRISNFKFQISNLNQLNEIQDEGEQTFYLTKYLLQKYPKKKWVIDAGALQVMKAEWLKQLQGNAIVTPHKKEFEKLFAFQLNANNQIFNNIDVVSEMAKIYDCIILLKGEQDIVCSPKECVSISGGNAGMTKGGTGDVLAGLVAAFACNNDLFLAATCASYINKKAGESLYEKVGYYFNASDLVQEIPFVMKHLLLSR